MVEFRILTNKDKEAVSRIFEQCFELPLEDLEISWNYRSKPNSFGFWQGKMVGFVLGSYHRRSGESLYIDYLALDESIRGKGLGTEIIQTFLSKFEGSVHLFPVSDTIAGWYLRNGFKESNKGYYVYHTYDLRSNKRITLLHTS